MAVLSLDFETGSLADLRRVGAHLYAQHPSTFVLCLAWAFDDEPVQVWMPGQPFPERVHWHIKQGGLVRGWNVTFEWLIWNFVLRRSKPWLPPLLPPQLSDTMAAASYWGLPLKLEDASQAVGTHIKDKQGHALMLLMTKPRSVDPFTGTATWWHETDKAKYARLCAYCAQDVEAERSIAKTIPPLPFEERVYWRMDLRLNATGVPLDLDLCLQLRDLAGQCSAHANRALNALTGGQAPTINSPGLLPWLRAHGYPEDNIRKDTVAERLADPLCFGVERTALELRGNAKTSAAKLTRMLAAAGADGRVRGMLQYYGAFRTGRWAGRLIQLHNLPRGTVKNIDLAIRLIERGADLDTLEALFGPGMDIVSSALRGCIAAPEGELLFVSDFSQIEARITCWLSGQQDMLDVFERGEDPYLYQAAQQGSTNRAFGKVLVLALGFGMGSPRFQATARTYGIDLTDSEAADAVFQWREANSLTRAFWWDVDAAVKRVIRRKVRIDYVRGVKFGLYDNRHLLIGLPSGRRLCYRDIDLGPDPVVDGRDCITYMGVNQYTKRWTRIRTWGSKLVENIVQALARDVMAAACYDALNLNLPLCLMIHDELVGSVPAAHADDCLRALSGIMRTRPAWAPGLPIDAAGWVGPRYKKG